MGVASLVIIPWMEVDGGEEARFVSARRDSNVGRREGGSSPVEEGCEGVSFVEVGTEKGFGALFGEARRETRGRMVDDRGGEPEAGKMRSGLTEMRIRARAQAAVWRAR